MSAKRVEAMVVLDLRCSCLAYSCLGQVNRLFQPSALLTCDALEPAEELLAQSRRDVPCPH